MYNYRSYGRSDVKNTEPGYAGYLWLAPVDAFLILQEPAPGVTPAQGDTLKIITSHTFSEDEGFIKIYLAPETLEAPGEMVGPKGAKRLKYSIKGFIPGESPALLEQVLKLINEDLIAIGKDANCPGGQLIQWGCDCSPVNVSAGTFAAANKASADTQKGYEVTLEAWCKYYYSGTITEKPEE